MAEQYLNKTGLSRLWSKIKSLITGNNEALLWDVIRLNVKGSTGITLTTLPDSITEIPDNEFENLENVALTTLPSGLTKIGASAFSNCPNVALTKTPYSLTEIGASAFENCISLNLSNWNMGKIASIGDYAFQGASSISILSFNKGMNIGKYAFSGVNVSIINDLDVGNGTIGDYAFKNCTSIGKVYFITAGVIGTSAFEGCTNLAISEYFGKEISATTINNNAFKDCTSLTEIVIGSNVNALKSFKFPAGGAFYNCTGLTSVTFKGKPTTIGSGVFRGCTNLTDIYVSWAEGEVANAPFGATNATIHYNYTGE